MKPQLLVATLICTFAASGTFADTLPEGRWSVDIKSKYPFTLQLQTQNGQASIPDGRVGESTATRVSTLAAKGRTLVVDVDFTGGRCGANSKGRLALKRNDKGKWNGTWSGHCASNGAKFNAKARASSP